MEEEMKSNSKFALKRAKSAESVGVDSKEVQAFIDECLEKNATLHTISVLRHGVVAAEAYRDPYGPDLKHMMYSVSKSVTSTAIGFAVNEGYLKVTDRFVDIFPESREITDNKYLELLTVDDLLSMRSGINVSPFMDKTKDNWFESILKSEWIYEPGTRFRYISENMYLLCCIIHKKVGMSVMDYLTPRLFEPLGITDVTWETDPRGIEAGGWGICLSPEDLAKFTLCYQQLGVFNSKQIIPRDWVIDATKKHASNRQVNGIDSREGYGYCFWRCGGCKDAYRADGMFCQFGIVFEKCDAAVIITGGEIDEQKIRDIVWHHFPKAFIEDDPDAKGITPKIPAFEKLKKSEHPLLEKELNGKNIKFNESILLNTVGFPLSVLTMPTTFMERDKAGNISDVSFMFMGEKMLFSWSEGDEINSICVGMDGEYRWDTMILGQNKYHTCAIAAWNSDTELELHIRAIETTGERVMLFDFKKPNVKMSVRSNPPLMAMLDNLKGSIRNLITPPQAAEAICKLLPAAAAALEMPHFGKIK